MQQGRFARAIVGLGKVASNEPMHTGGLNYEFSSIAHYATYPRPSGFASDSKAPTPVASMLFSTNS